MRRRFRIPHSEPTINLTPLIDVVFVILIVFLVAAPLLELEQISIAQAAPHSAETIKSVQAKSAITVYVRQDDTVWFEDQRRELATLGTILAEARQRYPNTVPQLIQDQKSHFGVYQSVKNAFEVAGFGEVELILRPGA